MKRLLLIGVLGLLVLFVATGARMMFDNSNEAKLRRAQEVVTVAPDKTTAGGPKWRPSLKVALDEAKKTGKPIMVDFYATWCGPCHLLDKAYNQPALVKELESWIPVRIDVDQNRLLASTYDASSLPTVLFLDNKGEEVGREKGFSVPSEVTEKELLGYVTNDVIDWLRQYDHRTKPKAV